ncbi:beta-ketoacyl-ACP synthase 3 [Frankia sp. CN7]|uniref:Beta-ketoacyl-ACP synthase 3 n=1 Tax=Frankia nepalensis TaxID=1836974 RepID=A0A937UW86_9ACTN|nr:beta-ketoacyl-ACP synthase 3 [Frankia nepalensis]MBL7509278.1 beta-ketoacyl-ACP synthase 3 [Frankia nepalensis]MBL7633136.1 beta-ketoacyl-ACP synthase 3 [Frankia nepalensis]
MGGARLLGLGGALPTRVVTNDELCARLDSSDEWIRARTGVRTRRIAGAGESVAQLAAVAGGKALADAGLAPADVDLVILTSSSRPSQIPGLAPEIADLLGIRAAGTFDTIAGCAGFCYALATAASAVTSGTTRNALVVASERVTDYANWDDPKAAPLWGDGAGAAVVGGDAGFGGGGLDEGEGGLTAPIGPPVWGHDGSRKDLIRVPGGGDDLLRMDGRSVFRWAASLAPKLREACQRAGIQPAELAGVVVHQANLRLVDALVDTLGADRAAIARDVVEVGNTSAASIPLALTRMRTSGELRPGDPVLLFAFGAGLTYCGQVIRCP